MTNLTVAPRPIHAPKGNPMKKAVSAITLFLMSLPAFAVDDEAASVVPQVDADPTGMIVFAAVLVAIIGYYAYVIWRAEQKRKREPK
jgi:hypothetical protein